MYKDATEPFAFQVTEEIIAEATRLGLNGRQNEYCLGAHARMTHSCHGRDDAAIQLRGMLQFSQKGRKP
jgi:hypothetical protein